MKIIVLGLVFVIIGILLFIFNEYDFVTTGKIIRVGELKIVKENNNLLAWSPWLGVAVMLIGLATTAIGIVNRR